MKASKPIKVRNSKSALFDAIKSHAPLLIFSALYVVLAVSIAPVTVLDLAISGLGGFLFMLFSMSILILIIKSLFLFFEMMFVIKPDRPLSYWFLTLKAYFAKNIRLSYTLPLLIGLFIFISSFTAVKSQIAVIHPFSFDIDLDKLDLWLHFGYMPWELLHSFLSHPVWSIVVGYMYNLWFFIIIYAFFLACFGYQKYEIGIRYLIASLLLWSFAGNGLAMLFSSAGPCFYHGLNLGNDPYAGLMTRLNEINTKYSPILSLNVQHLLWEGYQTNNATITGGISAFPSLHVASSVLVARAAFAQKYSIRWILAGFATMILVGSIYLGWHYAIDGYVGVVLGLAAWAISGPISKWYVKRKSFKAPC